MNKTQLSHFFAQYRLSWRGFVLTALPLLALAAPLLWHQSTNPWRWSYSGAYFVGLMSIGTFSLALSLWLGARCQRKGNLQPAFKFFVPLGLVSGTALLTEILLRLTAPDVFSEYRRAGHRKALLVGFEAERQFSWRGPAPAGGWVEYHTDQFGFRVNCHTPNWCQERTNQAVHLPARRSSAPLIFTLGESSVFGRFLEDDETWPHILQGNLRQAGCPATVVNSGNWGHNSVQTMLRLYVRILPHKPDFVLYYAAFNDASRHRLAPGDIALEEAVAFSDSLPCYVRIINRHKNFYCRTMLYYHLSETFPRGCKQLLHQVFGTDHYQRLKASLKKQDTSSASQRDDQADVILHNGQRYLANLRTMVDMCKRNGTRLVLVTFACDRDRIDPYTRRCIEHYNEIMRQVAREEGLHLVDMEAAFSPLGDLDSYFVEDHYHPSRRGAEQIAAVLAKAFPEWGAQKTASKR